MAPPAPLNQEQQVESLGEITDDNGFSNAPAAITTASTSSESTNININNSDSRPPQRPPTFGTIHPDRQALIIEQHQHQQQSQHQPRQQPFQLQQEQQQRIRNHLMAPRVSNNTSTTPTSSNPAASATSSTPSLHRSQSGSNGSAFSVVPSSTSSLGNDRSQHQQLVTLRRTSSTPSTGDSPSDTAIRTANTAARTHQHHHHHHHHGSGHHGHRHNHAQVSTAGNNNQLPATSQFIQHSSTPSSTSTAPTALSSSVTQAFIQLRNYFAESYQNRLQHQHESPQNPSGRFNNMMIQQRSTAPTITRQDPNGSVSSDSDDNHSATDDDECEDSDDMDVPATPPPALEFLNGVPVRRLRSQIPLPQQGLTPQTQQRMQARGFRLLNQSATPNAPAGPGRTLNFGTTSSQNSSNAGSLSNLAQTQLQQQQQYQPPSSHSHFRYKIVCKLTCRFCEKDLCWRAMKAILLADTKVELYSTDAPPHEVALVNQDYTTQNCRCRIQDAACLGCGNVVGYHVTQPCETCLESCNNGHFWMFQTEGVRPSERLDSTGLKPMLWAFLPSADRDVVALTGGNYVHWMPR